MNSTEPARLSVRSPADMVAAVPYLLGFHPADSVVVVAVRGRRVVFAARGDLPAPGADPGPAARHLAQVVARQDADAATVVGYGPAARVTGVVDAIGDALTAAGLVVLDALRVTEGRWFSYLCVEPSCCPPEGTPYDPAASQVSAAAVFAGQVALPDRAALAAQVSPLDGPVRLAMRRATGRARLRLAALTGRPSTPWAGSPAGGLPADSSRAGAEPPVPADGAGPEGESSVPVGGPGSGGKSQVPAGGAGSGGEPRAVRTAGTAAVRAAFRRQRRGERLDDDEMAWLTVLLTHVAVRDHAWSRTDGRDEDISLWTDVLRRAEPDLIAAPGCLLAFAAWRSGHGALAAVALERVLSAHPGYSLAVLLDEALRRGVAPSALDGWPGSDDGAVLRRRRRRPRR
ncbi:DUF4192 domain-containing protein [Micromonospora aurantiaca (nom. illeg.)]|uniref:DUF4192 domain-containing protein n=2 Tax=Micromonospora aurantiaca (nom. illeg.) TaxID=47850 RepID=A0A1C6TDC2_9ACTN|nr:DUF4192 domain-containing protein [Micromonospora aurantiaca]AXH89824.1 DUF4192 domain-containing protein [Micromonospora aurantiaca]SCL39771.1 protein of unknown function [Micromonospora aurantiaca]